MVFHLAPNAVALDPGIRRDDCILLVIQAASEPSSRRMPGSRNKAAKLRIKADDHADKA